MNIFNRDKIDWEILLLDYYGIMLFIMVMNIADMIL